MIIISDPDELRSAIKMIVTTELNYVASDGNHDLILNAKGRILKLIDQQFDNRKSRKYPPGTLDHDVRGWQPK